jgi:hypothetical protein
MQTLPRGKLQVKVENLITSALRWIESCVWEAAVSRRTCSFYFRPAHRWIKTEEVYTDKCIKVFAPTSIPLV